MKKRVLCIHHNDIDGRCSAEIVRRAFPGQVSFHEMAHGEPTPNVDPEVLDRVVMVDFSFQPFSRMLDFKVSLERAGVEFVWIDHHSSAIEDAALSGFDCEGLRRIGLAGCELTWLYYQAEHMPSVVHYAGRFDVWDHTDPLTLPIHFAMEAMDLAPGADAWDHLFALTDGDLGDELAPKGEAIMAYVDKVNAELVSDLAFPLEFEGVDFIAANLAGRGLDRFKSVAEGHQAVMGFYLLKGGIWTVGMYSEGDGVDLGAIAKKHGGGGHRGAAGFQCRELPFDLPFQQGRA